MLRLKQVIIKRGRLDRQPLLEYHLFPNDLRIINPPELMALLPFYTKGRRLPGKNLL